MSHSSEKPNTSRVRQTRAIAGDRTKSPTIAPPDAEVERLLRDMIQPATWAQGAPFPPVGLRERVLTLPVMVAFVLALLWRHIGSVREAGRVLPTE
jgi:hypothetical protein